MISHGKGDKFAQLLKDTREREGLRQEDIADVLGVDRSLITKWEAGEAKRPVSAEDINKLARLTRTPVLAWVISLGYAVEDELVKDEGDAVLLRSYQLASDETRRVVRLALGIEPQRQPSELGRSLRRLAATDRQGRPETQG